MDVSGPAIFSFHQLSSVGCTYRRAPCV